MEVGKLSYEPLWNTLNKLNLSKMDLIQMADITKPTMAKMGKDEPVTLTIIMKICNALDCRIDDVVDYIPEKKYLEGIKKFDVVKMRNKLYVVVGGKQYDSNQAIYDYLKPEDFLLAKNGGLVNLIRTYYLLAPIEKTSYDTWVVPVNIHDKYIDFRSESNNSLGLQDLLFGNYNCDDIPCVKINNMIISDGWEIESITDRTLDDQTKKELKDKIKCYRMLMSNK